MTEQPPYVLLRDEEAERNILARARDSLWMMADGGEPEDATFTRDYAPVVNELNRLATQLAEEQAQVKEQAATISILRKIGHETVQHRAKVSCEAKISGRHRETCQECGRECVEVASGFTEDGPEREPETYWRHLPRKGKQ